MRGKLYLLLTFVCLGFIINAQCPLPDGSFCYSNSETNTVAFEICPDPGFAVSAEIFQGEFETGFDFLTVYDGPTGSGTSGTQVFNSAGNLQGTLLGPSTVNNCLIFVVNSDGSTSCSTGSFKELLVFKDNLPAYDISYCYGDSETDLVIGEICPAPGFTVNMEICKGTYEPLFGDGLSIYEGTTGSGTGGTKIFGPSDGDLTNTIVSTNSSGLCMIFISNSDNNGSCSGASSTEETLYAEGLQALPIGIVNFRGSKDGDYNVLRWQTNYEIGNKRQLIQRSLNGIDEWTEMAPPEEFISDEFNHYTVVDKDPARFGYYRIKSIDFDGFIQYSSTIVLKRDEKEILLNVLNVFPNPVYDIVMLDMISHIDDELYVTLYDVHGRKVSSTIQRIEEGPSTIELNLRGLASGKYFINLSNSSVNQTLKIFKL